MTSKMTSPITNKIITTKRNNINIITITKRNDIDNSMKLNNIIIDVT